MKDFLQQVPGFRSNKTWKKVTASIFYALLLMSIIGGGLEGLLITGGLGLLVFSIIEIVGNKRKGNKVAAPIAILLIAAILIAAGGSISTENKAIAEDNEKIESLMKDNKELKSEIEDLKSVNENLKSDNEELKSLDNKFEDENNELKSENNELEDEVRDLKEEIEELKKDVKDLEAKKEREKKEQEKKVAAASKKSSTKSSSTKSTVSGSTNTKSSSKKTVSSGSGNSSKGSSSQSGKGQVYVTPTGSKYHSKACGRGNYTASTLANAKARGLTPCSKCY